MNVIDAMAELRAEIGALSDDEARMMLLSMVAVFCQLGTDRDWASALSVGRATIDWYRNPSILNPEYYSEPPMP